MQIINVHTWRHDIVVYPKKYAHGFCFAVLCCGYTLTDFPISIRLTSLALWQSNDCPSASKATLMNMDKYFMWIHYERLHNHNKVKHNKTVCIFLGIYCPSVYRIHTQNTHKHQSRTILTEPLCFSLTSIVLYLPQYSGQSCCKILDYSLILNSIWALYSFMWTYIMGYRYFKATCRAVINLMYVWKYLRSSNSEPNNAYHIICWVAMVNKLYQIQMHYNNVINEDKFNHQGQIDVNRAHPIYVAYYFWWYLYDNVVGCSTKRTWISYYVSYGLFDKGYWHYYRKPNDCDMFSTRINRTNSHRIEPRTS